MKFQIKQQQWRHFRIDAHYAIFSVQMTNIKLTWESQTVQQPVQKGVDEFLFNQTKPLSQQTMTSPNLVSFHRLSFVLISQKKYQDHGITVSTLWFLTLHHIAWEGLGHVVSYKNEIFHFIQWSIFLPSENRQLKFCILGQQFTESGFIQYEVW